MSTNLFVKSSSFSLYFLNGEFDFSPLPGVLPAFICSYSALLLESFLLNSADSFLKIIFS